MQSEHIRNVGLDLVFTILTCGLFNLYIQHKQMQAVNKMLGEERYSFLPWLLFSILTCFLYHIYHEYKMSKDIAQVMKSASDTDAILTLVLSVFGLTFVVDALQQLKINEYFGSQKV